VLENANGLFIIETEEFIIFFSEKNYCYEMIINNNVLVLYTYYYTIPINIYPVLNEMTNDVVIVKNNILGD